MGIAAANVDEAAGNTTVDLVVADERAGGVRWLQGRGTGAFQLRALSSLAEIPFGLAIADFDGDGFNDVATLDRSQGTLVVGFGDGNGSFSASVPVAVGGDVRSLAAADRFIAVADASTNHVVLARVDEGRNLVVVDSLPVGAEPVALAAGDFDGNGLADVAVANRGAGTVTILRQGGGRVFSVFGTVTVGSGVSAVAWGDVDRDGAADLVAALDSGEVVVFHNDARRNFRRVFAMPAGLDPIAIFVLDDRSPGQVVTGDGRPDIVLLHRGADDIGVLSGVGDGRFEASSRLVVGADPVGLAAGNFDEDEAGAVDLASANSDGTVSVIRGQGGGSFVASVSFATSAEPVAFQIADFDRDGFLDVLVLNHGDGTLSLLRGNGRGSLRPRQDFAAFSGAKFLAAGDFDGDGFVDAAVARDDQARISILPNGVAGFGLPKTLLADGTVSALIARDLDRDGRADLLALQLQLGRALVWRSAGPSGFEPARLLDMGSSPVSAVVADVVGDSNPDVVVGVQNPDQIVIFAGLGGAEFQEVARVDLPAVPSQLAVDDFIADGIPDIAVLSSFAGRLDVLAGRGSGRWEPAGTQPVELGTTGLASADLNGNGVSDLVAVHPEGSTVTVWSGNGNGQYLVTRFPVGRGPQDVRVANLNVASDATGGLAELVTLNTGGNTVTVLRNISRATLPPATVTPTLGPGTPPPPDSPTPLPTRTRRPAGAGKSSGGCHILGRAGAVREGIPLFVGVGLLGAFRMARCRCRRLRG
ncbi:MAG: hypothetical protein KatS3mg077_0957 [Candidatus Binatia bacterium]|nr:MAG: hypothetical protein KatS3mg077_0957 [Candidatus Binatia bacterium]